MILMSPVLCISDSFSFYHIIRFIIFYIFCLRTNQICLVMSLINMVLTLDTLVRTFSSLFVFVLKVSLVVLVLWGLKFFHQQESSQKVIFLHLTFLYQQDSS